LGSSAKIGSPISIPFFGGKKITPILIKEAEGNSSYWRATEIGTWDMAKFLTEAGQPDRLKEAPDGDKYLTADEATLKRGKLVFADTCARCHSSKLPDFAWKALDPGGCSGPRYLKCFRSYWELTNTDEFKAKMREPSWRRIFSRTIIFRQTHAYR
jgi:mono/diheme cytochrome c family protein